MIDYAQLEVWFLTGSQHLYGAETLAQVERDALDIVRDLNDGAALPLRVVSKPVLTTGEEIGRLLQEPEKL